MDKSKMSFDFWEEWENVSKIEEKAISSLMKARKELLKKMSDDKLVAIYIKGSFVRREMNEKSDVDMVPIVKKK